MTFFIPLRRSPTSYITAPYWEHNEWKRRHGYQFPLDPYLLLQWGTSILIDLIFFYFLIYFITDIPENQQPSILSLLEKSPLLETDGPTTSTWLCANYARQISFLYIYIYDKY